MGVRGEAPHSERARAALLEPMRLAICTLLPLATALRGFGDGKSGQHEDLHLLRGVSWWYSWGLTPHANMTSGPFDQTFEAMVWGKHMVDDLATWVPHRSTTHLLGFNEPNLRKQSNLSAEEACACA